MNVNTHSHVPEVRGDYPWLQAVAEQPEADGGTDKSNRVRQPLAAVPRVCLSRADAALALGIGLSTLRAWERNGAAPPFIKTPGGRVVYPVALLVKWSEERATSAHNLGGFAGTMDDSCLTHAE